MSSVSIEARDALGVESIKRSRDSHGLYYPCDSCASQGCKSIFNRRFWHCPELSDYLDKLTKLMEFENLGR